MRTNRAITFLPFLLAAILTIPVASSNANGVPNNLLDEEVVIRIEGMTCSACANGVAATLRRVDGVIEADVSMEPPQAHIQFDLGRISAEALVEAIEDLGYEAEVVDRSTNETP